MKYRHLLVLCLVSPSALSQSDSVYFAEESRFFHRQGTCSKMLPVDLPFRKTTFRAIRQMRTAKSYYCCPTCCAHEPDSTRTVTTAPLITDPSPRLPSGPAYTGDPLPSSRAAPSIQEIFYSIDASMTYDQVAQRLGAGTLTTTGTLQECKWVVFIDGQEHWLLMTWDYDRCIQFTRF